MHPLQELVEKYMSNNITCRSYSGRGMYGKSCLGIDCENLGQLFQNIILNINNFNEDEQEEIADAFLNFKTDSMCKDIIVYFPDIKYEESEDDEEDE